MKKLTLKFPSLESLCAFQKRHLHEAYFINTIALTLTARIPENLFALALAQYDAQEMSLFSTHSTGQKRQA